MGSDGETRSFCYCLFYLTVKTHLGKNQHAEPEGSNEEKNERISTCVEAE